MKKLVVSVVAAGVVLAATASPATAHDKHMDADAFWGHALEKTLEAPAVQFKEKGDTACEFFTGHVAQGVKVAGSTATADPYIKAIKKIDNKQVDMLLNRDHAASTMPAAHPNILLELSKGQQKVLAQNYAAASAKITLEKCRMDSQGAGKVMAFEKTISANPDAMKPAGNKKPAGNEKPESNGGSASGSSFFNLFSGISS